MEKIPSEPDHPQRHESIGRIRGRWALLSATLTETGSPIPHSQALVEEVRTANSQKPASFMFSTIVPEDPENSSLHLHANDRPKPLKLETAIITAGP